jgi:3-phosphoshikimate 1-carboxyvinyltransferase
VRVGGSIRVPGDKSISHRALIVGALSTGTTVVRDILDSQDVRSTAGVLRELGVSVPPFSREMAIHGVGLRGLTAPRRDLDCGNSGTSVRLLAGVVAACPFSARFTGDASLSRRPMKRVARPLEAMGAHVQSERGEGLPLVVIGTTLRGIDWRSETASAQVKSAILLAGLVGRVRVSVREPIATRDHTERMLAARGVDIGTEGATVTMSPVEVLHAVDVQVPADPSSAAFFAGLAALSSDGELLLPDVCVNPARTGFLQVLRRMGARVEVVDEQVRGNEPVATLRVAGGSLRAVEIGGDEVPSMIDELPLIACLGARATGETRIRGAAELRVKESDRIATVVANLRAIGAEASELPDGLIVRGSDAPLRGRVTTYGDHRIAMAFGVLGAATGGAVDVDDPACVDVSFPGFWDRLRRSVIA